MSEHDPKLTVLFLCTGNSCRSQMAEGWTRHLKGDRIRPLSAGLMAKGLNPLAVKVMAELGVDISEQTSDKLDRYLDQSIDVVVTVCGHAHETCPVFPGGARVVHRGFDDPPALADGETDPDRALAHYRRVRDEIRDFVETLPDAIA